MSRFFRDEYTPWSFVVPIALAVMIGVLSADVVRIVVAGVMARAALQELNESMSRQMPRGHVPTSPGLIQTPSQGRPAQSVPYASTPALPGLLRANRDNLNRACLGGTVSLRESNGWSQDRSTGSPQACTATSQ
jgi:hypothetical protein